MRYFSMFSGIGGFELGIGEKHTCVGYSEIDKYAIQCYETHFRRHKNYGDATELDTSEIPYFDWLVGGFPCPSFSVAGHGRGFDDARGNLFFEIARVLRDKKPRYFCLENVKGLLSNKQGETFKEVLRILSDLGYSVQWQVLNSKHYGVPQSRNRIFIIGHTRGTRRPEILPLGGSSSQPTQEISEGQDIISGTMRCRKGEEAFRPMRELVAPTLTARARQDGSMQPCIAVLTPERAEKRQNGRRFKTDGEPAFTLTAQDRHGVMVGRQIRRLTPLECERLQGFPDGHTAMLSDTQRYKCLGNAVTVNVIKEIFKDIA